jgi:hypothetical protein
LSTGGETKVRKSEINTNQDKQAPKTITKDKNKQLPRQQILKIKDMQHESHQYPEMSSCAAEG